MLSVIASLIVSIHQKSDNECKQIINFQVHFMLCHRFHVVTVGSLWFQSATGDFGFRQKYEHDNK